MRSGIVERPGARLWLMQAERDGMHPAAMAYVFSDLTQIGSVPGLWDAVSDILAAGGPAIRPCMRRDLVRLLGVGRAECVAVFSVRVSRLPDPAEILATASPPPAGLAFAQAVRLVRHACAAPMDRRGDAVETLFARAPAALPVAMHRWIGLLVEGGHGIRLDRERPAQRRYLDLYQPCRGEA